MGVIKTNVPVTKDWSTGTQENVAIRGSDNATNVQLAEINNQANYQLAQQQNSWNVDQWNRENEYNSPENQVKLLQDAGLNPNMYKGDSTSSQLTSANMTNNQAAQIQPGLRGQQVMQGLSTGLDALKTAAEGSEYIKQIQRNDLEMSQMRQLFPHQLSYARLLNELTDAQRQQTEHGTKGIILNNEINRLTKMSQVKNAVLQNSQIEGNILQMDANTKNIFQSMNNDITRLGYEGKLNEWNVKNLMQSIRESVTRARLNDSQSGMNEWSLSIMRKFNIDPRSSWVNNIITLGLSKPEQFNNVMNTIETRASQIFGSQEGSAASRLGLDFTGWLSPTAWKNYFHHGLNGW